MYVDFSLSSNVYAAAIYLSNWQGHPTRAGNCFTCVGGFLFAEAGLLTVEIQFPPPGLSHLAARLATLIHRHVIDCAQFRVQGVANICFYLVVCLGGKHTYNVIDTGQITTCRGLNNQIRPYRGYVTFSR